jgi:hypothetical protein
VQRPALQGMVRRRRGPQRPNFLRKEMEKRLANGSACFDFMVQPQVSRKDMPVEDTVPGPVKVTRLPL